MNIIKLNAIASTNSHLRDLARSTHLQDSTVVVTSEQTNGRGQRGAVWQSIAGKSLTFSVFKQFNALPAERHFDLSMVVSIAIARVLSAMKIPNISIKWPNDIMSAQKKCAGILIENKLESNRIVHSVIGIGLNVNEKELIELPQATSLHLQTGMLYDLDALLLQLSQAIVDDLCALEGIPANVIRKRYEDQLFRKDLISVFENGQKEQINGIIRGVTDRGLLRVEHDDAVFTAYDLKQVKLCY